MFNDSLKSVQHESDMAITQLTEMFGVVSELYLPKGLTGIDNDNKLRANKLHGYNDDDIEFEQEPFFFGKVLIPSYFRKINSHDNTYFRDLNDQRDLFAYLPRDLSIPTYTKIVVKEKDDNFVSFKVEQQIENRANSLVIWQKYLISPFATIEEEDLRRIDRFNEAHDPREVDDSIIRPENPKKTRTYKPIKG